MVKTNTMKPACCSTRQKVYGIIALAGLFACGVMIGVTLNGNGNRPVKEIGMSEVQCNQIASQITMVAQGVGCADDCISTMRELNEIYIKNCAGRTFEVQAPKPAPNVEDESDKKTCEVIEELLTEQTYRCETNAECHINNAKIYANISERGCPENRQRYVHLAAKELEIARALQDDNFNDFDRAQISDTYKRIQMKQNANEILNKVQQLADPAIDFIIQAQKIIEE